MKNLFFKALMIGLLLLALPMKQYGQEVRKIKISELNISSIRTIEERTFLIHSIQDLGYYCLRNYDKPNTIDVYMPDDPSFECVDFDALLEDLYNECVSFTYLDKSERGELYVQWIQDLDDEVNFALYESFTKGTRTDNATCETAAPFCTDNGAYTFPAGVDSGSPCGNYTTANCSAPYKCTGTPGQSSNCLSTAPNPAFYYMKIATAGNLNIKIYSEPRNDIDFDCWGPFNDITNACSQLSCSNIVDCSYAGGTGDEYCHINNAQPGKYYILLLTNYSNTPCNIHFENVGTGTTDCGILPPLVENGGPYCVGDNIQLSGNAQQGATYTWSGPGGWTASGHTVNRPNCTMAMAGTYTCTITLNGQTNSATTEVRIYPKPTANFTATSVCKGETTQFTNSSTTTPANQNVTYLWNFGDGQTSSQTSPSHSYAEAGNYSVSLTASCGNGSCTNTKTQNVTVYQTPVASATATNSVVQYGGTTQLHGSGGTGSFTYHWEPANKVVNANIQNPQTVGLTETTTFTVTVTQPQGNCNSTAQVIVSVQGSNMTASASASPSSICRGETTQLNAIAVGGNANNYTYLWSPSQSLSDPIIANPIAQPNQTTTYTCTVSDGYTTQNVTTTVTVNNPEHEDEYLTICPGDSINFYGTYYSTAGDHEYQTTTAQGCEKTITLHLSHYPSYDHAHTTTEYICPGTSYNFHGHYYNATGLYSENLHTIHGCDSIVWLNLTVYPTNDTIIVDPTICTSQTYNFHGVEYNHDGDIAYFDTIDNHGCLLVEKLVLSVGPYQMPPMQQQFECFPHDGSPSYYWDKTGQTYTQDTYDEIILPDPEGGCDIKYRLNLKFHQEFYQTDTLTVCDEYEWPVVPGSVYDHTNHHIVKTFHDVGGPGFACDSTYILDLTVNHRSVTDSVVLNQCNQFEWQFGWNNETYTLTEQDDYTKTIDTHLGCDSIVTLKLQLDYTPSFPKVEGKKWVVGGSEFQYTIERYWINLDYPKSTHKTTWTLYDNEGNRFNKWEIIPYDNDDKCYLYIYTFERDTIWLHAHTESIGECECGEDEKSIWIVCGYQDVEETLDPHAVNIFPNPNDGNMILSFDNMEGENLIKVYNITGTLVDQFTLHNDPGHQNYSYQTGRLTPGIYFFNIINKKGILTKKVIIID